MSFGSQARAQFQRLTGTGQQPTTGQPGTFALNLTDKKLWTFDPVGAPIRVTRSILAHDPALAYGEDDIVITGDTLWQAIADIPPKAFTPADWLRLGATSTTVSSNPTGSGVYTGGVLSSPGGNTIDVTAGTGIIINASVPAAPTRVDVSWGALSGAITAGGSVVRAITINAAGALGSVDVSQIVDTARQRIVLGFVYYDDIGNITRVQNTPRVPAQTAQDFPELVNALGGPFRSSGATISSGGGLTIDVTQGEVYGVNLLFRSTPDSPNFAQFPLGSGIVFDVVQQDGEIVAGDATDVPNAIYEAGAIPPGFATIHYLFSTPSRQDCWLQLGQQIYDSITSALLSLDLDWASYVTPFTQDTQTVFLGAVVIVRDATDLTIPAEGAVIPTTPGPRVTQRFIIETASIEFLRLDGTSAMQGPLDMNGNAVQNATIDEGVF